MITTTQNKLLALTSPSTTSSYYLKDKKTVWDYDSLDKTSVASATVLVGAGGRRYKLAGSIIQPVPVPEPIPEPIPQPIPGTNIIDVAAKYGVRTGTIIDNTAALLKLNADFKGYGKPLVEFDFTKCGIGEIRFSTNRWIEGVDKFIINATGINFRCTREPGGFFTDHSAFFNDGIYWKGGGLLNENFKFKTANKGDRSITLIEGTSLSTGQRIYLEGFEEQGYGEPKNPRCFEWKVVESVSGNVVTFTEPLKWGYNELWKDWMMWGFLPPSGNGHGPVGKPRLYKIPDTYPTYAKFIGCVMGRGINQPNQPSYFIFKGMDVILERCTIEENWPTESKKQTFINCKIDGSDADKNVELLEYIGCTTNGIHAATGVDIFKIINCTIDGPCKLSPRELYLEGNTSTVTTEHNFQPHPEPSWIEKITIKNNTFIWGGLIDKPNKAVEFSGNWVSVTFTPSSVNSSELYLPDDSTNQIVIRKLGFGSEISHSDGSVKATVKDIIHNGTHWIIQLTNISGTIKVGTWRGNLQQKVIDLGGNKSLSGQAIY